MPLVEYRLHLVCLPRKYWRQSSLFPCSAATAAAAYHCVLYSMGKQQWEQEQSGSSDVDFACNQYLVASPEWLLILLLARAPAPRASEVAVKSRSANSQQPPHQHCRSTKGLFLFESDSQFTACGSQTCFRHFAAHSVANLQYGITA